MRIIAGANRGKRLAGLGAGDAGAALRPTSDRVREAIFNLLQNGGHGDRVAGARVLDLFAGTGALGLEALSRGAFHATFVDNGAAARGLLRANVEACAATDRATMLRRDATRPGQCPGPPADLVFLDPPYGRRLGQPALAAALAGDWLAPGAFVVWEEADPPGPVPGLAQHDRRRYGDTIVTLLSRAS